ncbi:hypothetical protein HY642_00600 [Candidatus Woesearchaeota archaeon]|nr:hypothetical protein [Candidatus Woesearchaeota archaeon]
MSKYGAALDIGKVLDREQAVKEQIEKLREEERNAKQDPEPKHKSPVPLIAICLIVIFGAWLLLASLSKDQRAYNKATGCAVASLSETNPNVTVIEWDMRLSEDLRMQLAVALLDDNTTRAAASIRALSCGTVCNESLLIVSEDTIAELVSVVAHAEKRDVVLSSAGMVRCDGFEDFNVCDNVIVENVSAVQNSHPIGVVRKGELFTAGGNETIVLFDHGDDVVSFRIDSRLANSTLVRLFTQDAVPGFQRVYLAESPRVTAWLT